MGRRTRRSDRHRVGHAADQVDGGGGGGVGSSAAVIVTITAINVLVLCYNAATDQAAATGTGERTKQTNVRRGRRESRRTMYRVSKGDAGGARDPAGGPWKGGKYLSTCFVSCCAAAAALPAS